MDDGEHVLERVTGSVEYAREITGSHPPSPKRPLQEHPYGRWSRRNYHRTAQVPGHSAIPALIATRECARSGSEEGTQRADESVQRPLSGISGGDGEQGSQ